MNAVNLLPAKHRPRTPTGGMQGSSYAVIGVLGVVCVMVLLFVLTSNGISSDKQAISRTQAETAQAKKQAEQLAPYGNFIQVKEQRVNSVKQLATGRIDWERLARGLAHLLPKDVWLISANAAASGQKAGAGGGQSQPPPAPGGAGGDAGAAANKPELSLIGCARNHPAVAVALLRLKHLPAVEDVELASIEKPEVQETTPGQTGGAPAGGEDCGQIKKKNAYKWEAKVTFKPQAGSTPTPEKKVPARLGGGA
jgi:Tfp pilus assembly protein PilN